MPYVDPGAVTTGTTITSTWGNAVRNAEQYLANPPACRVYHNAAQSLAHNTDVTIAFNSERFDTDTMHDTVTNNSRITMKTAGLYVVTFMGAFFSAVDYNLAQAWFRVNNATNIAGANFRPAAGGEIWPHVTTIYKFAANDYVEVHLLQTNGASAARNLIVQPNYSPEFSAVWIGLG